MVDAGRRRLDGRRLDGYTISLSCEPNGSGELINIKSTESLSLHKTMFCQCDHCLLRKQLFKGENLLTMI